MLDEFVQDMPQEIARPKRALDDAPIQGIVLDELAANTDERGQLIELITTRDATTAPIVHVYQVVAAPGSLRSWVYHKWQQDRLHFTMGDFEVHLVDIRPDSPTRGAHMILKMGHRRQCRLTIPPLVAHSVRNIGDSAAGFVNMPSRIYDPGNPDKFRYDGSFDEFLQIIG